MEKSTTAILSDEELEELRRAKELLENPGLTARLANVIGAPLERGFAMLPHGWTETVNKAAQKALERALKLATLSLGRSERRSSELWHKVAAGASGGIGGAFGLPALPFELPISTTLILRGIAEVARQEGHSLESLETRMACLEVFAFGGKSGSDDASENAYWIVRAGLAKAVSEAMQHVARRGLAEEAAPAIVRLITSISARFGVMVSHQVAAKAIPVAGALAGSTLNVLFMDHFQKMARGHFIVKRLEAKYGTAPIREAYEAIALKIAG